MCNFHNNSQKSNPTLACLSKKTNEKRKTLVRDSLIFDTCNIYPFTKYKAYNFAIASSIMFLSLMLTITMLLPFVCLLLHHQYQGIRRIARHSQSFCLFQPGNNSHCRFRWSTLSSPQAECGTLSPVSAWPGCSVWGSGGRVPWIARRSSRPALSEPRAPHSLSGYWRSPGNSSVVIKLG